MPTLATNKDCTACAACVNICSHKAISMMPDDDSFMIPMVNSQACVECKLCEKACPIVSGRELKHPQPKNAIAFWDNETRNQSSSGGAFSAIARWVLQRNGAVFGASWLEDFNCAHKGVYDEKELSNLRGSKYVQSDIGATFAEAKKALQKDKYVLFSGTPCQIAGLRSFLLKDYPKLITVDLVCHGVPSNALFDNYIKKLKSEYKEYAPATGFEFRKRQGWGIAPALTFPKLAGVRNRCLTGVQNVYMNAFQKSAIFRESCYDCRFNGLQRVGDITIADFWGIGCQGTPFKHDVSEGVSLILANSEKGQEVMDSLENCFVEKRDLQEAIGYNHNLVSSSKRPGYRESVIRAFNDPMISLDEIDRRFPMKDKGLKALVKTGLIRSGLFWPLKSIINKIKTI